MISPTSPVSSVPFCSTPSFLSAEDQKNLTRILQDISGETLNLVTESIRKTPLPFSNQWEDFLYTSRLFKSFFETFFSDPVQASQAQRAYWQSYLELWQKSLWHFSGVSKTSPFENAFPKDRRFQSQEWETHPFFNFIKNAYLLTSEHLLKAPHVTNLPEEKSKKIKFLMNFFLEALSPSNFFFTNPEVIRKTLETKGENLLQGLRHFLQDLESSPETFRISITDKNAFKVGENIAITPGKIIYQNELMQLIQYAPQTSQVYQYPLLVIPPWINKYYILDLSEKNSFVRWCVQRGYTVFLLSWVNPEARHAHKNFEDYMNEGPLEALKVIQKATGESKINAVGYCIGGTLLACTLAYLAAKNKYPFLTGTYLSTLLDFADAGDISMLLDEEQVNLLEHKMAQKGYLDGASTGLYFKTLRSNDLIWGYVIKNYLLGQEPFPFDILYWNEDGTNLPLKMNSFYLRNMYLKNLLAQPGALKLKNTPLDLRKIRGPLYIVGTELDHIVPWKKTYSNIKLHTCPITYVLGGSGHVAGIVNPPVLKKYGYYTHTTLEETAEAWLSQATHHEGSWWTHWEKWLRPSSGPQISAERPKGTSLAPLEEAPGSYVKRCL